MPGERRKSDAGLPDRKPFISAELRPPVLPERDRHPPLDPAAPASAIRDRIRDVLGSLRESQLWIGAGFSAESLQDDIFVPSVDVDSATLDGEVVLLNWRDGRYYTLNPVGSMVWELLSEGKALAVTTAEICERFDVPPGAARRDVAQLIRELEGAGVILRKEREE